MIYLPGLAIVAAGCGAPLGEDTTEIRQALDPDVSVTVFEPIENGAVIFERLAPANIGGPAQGRISMRMTIGNAKATDVSVTRIDILGQTVTSFSSPLQVPANGSLTVQNCLCTNYKPLVINAPFPTSAKVSVYGDNNSLLAEQTVSLSTHVNDGGPLAFVGKPHELRQNETWGATSNHVADHQVFALDVGVWGWDPGTSSWNDKFDGADQTLKQSYRVYGMPIHALADGTVCWALNDQPEWQAIGHASDPKPISPSMGTYLGGGDQIFVKSGDEIAVFAHLQPGSIPPELMVPGAVVTKGQYLGKAGFSGDTSWPAPHIHVKKEPAGGAPILGTFMNSCDAGFFRPMGFSGLQSITKDEATSLAASQKSLTFTQLKNQSAPDPYGLLYPSTAAFPFCPNCGDNRQYIGVMRASSNIDLRVKVGGWTIFKNQWSNLSADRFRLTQLETFAENGSQQFIGVFSRATSDSELTDSSDLQNVTSWDLLNAKADALKASGRRLFDVETYLDGNQRHFVGVFGSGTGEQVLVSAKGWNAFTQQWAIYSGQNLRLIDLETYDAGGGERQYLGIFRAGSGGYALWSGTGWTNFTKEWSTLSNQGLRLIDVETFPVGSGRQYVGVFRAGSDGYALFSITGYDKFTQETEALSSVGVRLVDVHVEGD